MNNEPTTYFISDEHYNHVNIIKYCSRPFLTIEEMNETIINNHNEVVKPNDIIYHLGDFCMQSDKVQSILSQLNGQHHLIPGNHDGCHSVHKRNAKNIRAYLNMGFLSINEQMTINLPPLGEVFLCHLPQAEYVNERYHEQRPINSGTAKYQFCGHVHDAWKTKGNMINVGVDQWNFYPITVEQIVKELKLNE